MSGSVTGFITSRDDTFHAAHHTPGHSNFSILEQKGKGGLLASKVSRDGGAIHITPFLWIDMTTPHV